MVSLEELFERCFYCNSLEDFKTQANIGIRHYNALIKEIYEIMRNDPFRVDDTKNPLLEKMKKEGLLETHVS